MSHGYVTVGLTKFDEAILETFEQSVLAYVYSLVWNDAVHFIDSEGDTVESSYSQMVDLVRSKSGVNFYLWLRPQENCFCSVLFRTIVEIQFSFFGLNDQEEENVCHMAQSFFTRLLPNRDSFSSSINGAT